MVDLNQNFESHEAAKRGPMTVGMLREALLRVPDSAPVALYSDEEGNGCYHLWCVDVGIKDNAVILRPAGDDLIG